MSIINLYKSGKKDQDIQCDNLEVIETAIFENININGGITFPDPLNIPSDLGISGDLGVSGDCNIVGNLSFGGVTFPNPLIINGELDVNGDVDIVGKLNVDGDCDVIGTLTAGSFTLPDPLVVNTINASGFVNCASLQSSGDVTAGFDMNFINQLTSNNGSIVLSNGFLSLGGNLNLNNNTARIISRDNQVASLLLEDSSGSNYIRIDSTTGGKILYLAESSPNTEIITDSTLLQFRNTGVKLLTAGNNPNTFAIQGNGIDMLDFDTTVGSELASFNVPLNINFGNLQVATGSCIVNNAFLPGSCSKILVSIGSHTWLAGQNNGVNPLIISGLNGDVHQEYEITFGLNYTTTNVNNNIVFTINGDASADYAFRITNDGASNTTGTNSTNSEFVDVAFNGVVSGGGVFKISANRNINPSFNGVAQYTINDGTSGAVPDRGNCAFFFANTANQNFTSIEFDVNNANHSGGTFGYSVHRLL